MSSIDIEKIRAEGFHEEGLRGLEAGAHGGGADPGVDAGEDVQDLLLTGEGLERRRRQIAAGQLEGRSLRAGGGLSGCNRPSETGEQNGGV